MPATLGKQSNFNDMSNDDIIIIIIIIISLEKKLMDKEQSYRWLNLQTLREKRKVQ
jgi:hypothetical protein